MNQHVEKRKAGAWLREKPKSFSFGTVLWALLLGIACMCFFAARWYLGTYGDTGFDSIVFTLFSDLGGVQSGLVAAFR